MIIHRLPVGVRCFSLAKEQSTLVSFARSLLKSDYFTKGRAQALLKSIHFINTLSSDIKEIESAALEVTKSDRDVWELFLMEKTEKEKRLQESLGSFYQLVFGADLDYDESEVILEIRAGAGGSEAGLFARELFEMYKRVAQYGGWSFSPIGVHDDGLNGLRVA